MAKKQTLVRADLLWKELLESFLYSALEIFYPALYEAVDLTKPPVPLNKELRVPGLHKANTEEKILDLLMDIPLKTGDFLRILLHVEVQAENTKEPFHVRMHNYACVITLTQKRPFAALAIRTTPQVKNEELSYEMNCFGTRHVFEYPTIFIDQLDEERLLGMKQNPVALAAVCVKRMQTAKKDEKKRYHYGKELLKMMEAAGYPDGDTYIRLLQFIEGITNLSAANLRKEFQKEMDVLLGEEKTTLKIRTPLLRKVLKNKAQEWVRSETKAEMAKKLLEHGIALDVIVKSSGLSTDEVRSLMD